MAFAEIGLVMQIVGVLIVLLSQVIFYFRTRKYGGLAKAFYAMVSIVRIGGGGSIEEITRRSEEEFRKTFPEWWALAEYLSDDIRMSSMGLALTLIGLLFELLP